MSASPSSRSRWESLWRLPVEKPGPVLAAVLLLTVVSALLAARVHPDFSVEMAFPHFDKSRIDYERFKGDFPFDEARAIVAVEAADLFTPAGIARIGALEEDLAHIPGVVDTRGPATVKDLIADGDAVRMEKLFPRPDLPPDELARRRVTATSDPLFAWNIAPPDGRAVLIEVTLTKEQCARDTGRAAFLKAARAVLADHGARAKKAGIAERLTLNGIPVVRAEFVELINDDLNTLFPLAFAVVVLLLYLSFRNFVDVLASVVTILFSVIWTFGVMGAAGVPLQMLTQLTPIVVMIISISDTVHVVTHYKDEVIKGAIPRQALLSACIHSAVPCLLTEITIAGGFLSLVVNDIVMIQQFGLITAAAMLLTWLANFTVLPLALRFLKPKPKKDGRAAENLSATARTLLRFVGFIEHSLKHRKRRIVVVAVLISGASLLLGLRAHREFLVFDDLRPQSQLAKDIRYFDGVHGGTVPLAVYVEPKSGQPRADAMLDPAALALLDRIGQHLETVGAKEVKYTSSFAKYMRKAHRLFAGEEAANKSALPTSRALVAQELLAIDDPRTLRDVLSIDRATGAVITMIPDGGSARLRPFMKELRAYLADEEQKTGYHITLTSQIAIADAVYSALVGGLAGSFAGALLVSFLIFCVVLRSWRLAAIALVPNVLPLLFTLALMSVLHIDIKPSTVVMFSITLVIADDDTIQYMARLRSRFLELEESGAPDPHEGASLDTLRDMGLPMFMTACAVSVGFLALMFSQFLALSNLGLLIGVSLLSAMFADLFLSPLLIMRLKPRIGKGARTAPPASRASTG